MSPIYCDECGRANGESAKTCIWCGVSILDNQAVGYIETTRVEIGYLDGLERLKDAAPVRLTISNEGVEVTELLPGTRSVRIPSSSIIEAKCVDASTAIEDHRALPQGSWLARLLSKLSLLRAKPKAEKRHDYIFTIKYEEGDETHTAVFHRDDRTGLPVVEGLVRIVTSAIRQRRADGGNAESSGGASETGK